MSMQLIDNFVGNHQRIPRSNQQRIFLLLFDQPQTTMIERLKTTKYERTARVFDTGHTTTPNQSISEMVIRISAEIMQTVDSCS